MIYHGGYVSLCNTAGSFLPNSFGYIALFHKTDLTASANPKIQDLKSSLIIKIKLISSSIFTYFFFLSTTKDRIALKNCYIG